MTLHRIDDPRLLVPLTEEAETVDRVWRVFLWSGAAVGVIVIGLILYAAVRFRRRGDQLPRQTHYNIPMEVAYTVVPLLIVVALVALTVTSIASIETDERDPDVTVDVVAFQWQWRFEYPETGYSVTGSPDRIPVLTLPADSTVRFRLESLDVIHSFWIIGLQYKRDIFPDRDGQQFQVTMVDRPGTYHHGGVCAEFCGLDHASMEFDVVVLPAAEFDEWMEATRQEVSR